MFNNPVKYTVDIELPLLHSVLAYLDECYTWTDPNMLHLDLGSWIGVPDIAPLGLLWAMPAASSCSMCWTSLVDATLSTSVGRQL